MNSTTSGASGAATAAILRWRIDGA